MKSQLFNKIDILGVRVDALNLDLACQKIGQWVGSRENVYVCVAPVSTLVDCQEDEQYRAVVNSAAMVTPDGMPVVWMVKLKGAKEVKRVYGPDLMKRLCIDEKGKYKHFFYGATENTLNLLEQKLRESNLDIRIAGKIAPAFQQKAELEKKEVIDMINNADPDILWVGLGSPKQDFWMALNRGKLNVPVIIGIGAAFDFLAGVKPQAPKWMQGCGLEWLFRLICEPKRLWKRYLIGNVKFIYYLLKKSFK